jgi:hypothetical protein
VKHLISQETLQKGVNHAYREGIKIYHAQYHERKKPWLETKTSKDTNSRCIAVKFVSITSTAIASTVKFVSITSTAIASNAEV